MEQPGYKSRSYRDLEVWKLAIDFVKKIYEITKGFPAAENFGLINQIRRAAVSIPSNIAIGQGRNFTKEFKQFPAISLSALAELATQLIIAKEIEYLTSNELDPLLTTLDRIRKMVKGLAKGIKQCLIYLDSMLCFFPITEN
jgi:four helix bundle protein